MSNTAASNGIEARKALLEAGWSCRGEQPVTRSRTITKASFPLAGAEMKTGGRQRWAGPGNRRCAGARTVCFFELEQGECVNFRTYSLKQDLDRIKKELASPPAPE